jgi:soluble lytic murein transglycosylase-like protein
MGYRGPARGLLDADTNLKYGVAYLSNAYLVADGNPERALALYASGYFYEARRKGLLGQLKTGRDS